MQFPEATCLNCPLRKNLFDLRRTGVVHNLHVLVRLLKDDPELFASESGTA